MDFNKQNPMLELAAKKASETCNVEMQRLIDTLKENVECPYMALAVVQGLQTSLMKSMVRIGDLLVSEKLKLSNVPEISVYLMIEEKISTHIIALSIKSVLQDILDKQKESN